MNRGAEELAVSPQEGAATPPVPEGTRARRLLDEGLVHLSLGREDDAVQAWRSALEHDPENPRALDYLETLGAIPPRHARESAEMRKAVPGRDETLDDEQSDDRPADAPVAFEPPMLGGLQEVADAAGSTELVVRLSEEDIVQFLTRAREDMEAGNLGSALDRCEDVLRRIPGEPRAAECAREVKDRLVHFYLEELKPLTQVPSLCATDATILELNLDPIAGFLLSQIDGDISLEELLTIMGTFDQFKVVSALHFFLRQSIVELKAPPPPPPPRR